MANANVAKWISIKVLVLFGYCIVRLDAADYCYTEDPNPNRNYSTKTPYREHGGDTPQRDHLEGCVPQHMWMFARHGTRYVSGEEMEEMEEYLVQLRQDIMDNLVDASSCTDDTRAVRSWTFRMTPDQSMRQSITGWDELKGLGGRLAERFPDILGVQYDENMFEFLHTNYKGKGDRTRDAARAFAEGAFGYYEGVSIIEQSSPDWLLHYYKQCTRYTEEVSSKPIPEYESFKQSQNTLDMIRKLELRIGLKKEYFSFDDIDLLYDICRVEYGLYGDSPWCSMFTPEAVNIMEFGEDVKYYWEDGYGSEINYQQACPLLRDLIDNLESAMVGNGKKFVGRFGHSVNMNTFLARLGFFREPKPLRGSRYHDHRERRWRTTQTSPMAANIAFVLYECSTEYYIEVYLNEELVQLPGCGDMCSFRQFFEIYGQFANNCDIEDLCKMTSSTCSSFSAHGILVALVTALLTAMY